MPPEAETIPDISTTAPPTLDHVVGQKHVVDQLRVALAAHWIDHGAGLRPTFGPCLMAGGPGLGKTLLASVISRELGGQLREVLGQTLSARNLHELLLDSSADSVLFVDECHELDDYAQTTFLRVLEERKLLLPRGPSSGRYTAIPVAPFTALFATTNPEGLIAPLRDRMR